MVIVLLLTWIFGLYLIVELFGSFGRSNFGSGLFGVAGTSGDQFFTQVDTDFEDFLMVGAGGANSFVFRCNFLLSLG